MIERIRNFSYERRLKLLKLHLLERCKVRGDLIEVFKWVKGFDKENVGKVLTISSQDEKRNNGFKQEPSKHCSDDVKTANKLVGFIGRILSTILKMLSLHYNINDYVTANLTSNTCDNGSKIIGKRLRCNEAKYFFFNRTMNIWNSLPA